MLALVQRVRQARVEVGGQVCGAIDQGLLVLLCAERGDTPEQARKMVDKIIKLRIFADEEGRMNRNVAEVGGGLLLVSQFTLAADLKSGNRPGFSQAAAPQQGRQLYDCAVDHARQQFPRVACGIFGADMQVHLINDGPVTIPLRIEPAALQG